MQISKAVILIGKMRCHIKRWAAASALIVLLVSPGMAVAQAVTRAFITDNPLQRGMIVKLNDKDNTKVEPVSDKELTKMLGVVVAANDSPVTLSDENATKQQVFVATTGRYEVLVSNQNGAVKKDDYVTVSSLAGVGMKADGSQSRILGKALESFDGKGNTVGQTTVKNSGGKQVPIALGMVGVEIAVGHNPIEAKKDSVIPGLEHIQEVAGSIAKKPITPAQLYAGMLVFILAAAIAGAILYAGIRTSMIAIGRNPLAKSSVMRNLISVVITSVIILIIGIVAVYLILKL
jgi:hypothetical protein